MKKLFHVAAPALSVPARRLFPAAVPAHFPARLPAAALFPARHPFRALASALSVLLAATLVALLTSCVADDPRDADTPAAGESAQAPSTNQTSSQQNSDGQTPTGEYVDDPLSGHSYNLDDYTAVTGKSITHFSESPLLTARVAAGELPPVEERLPDNPIVVIPWETIGTYGGTLRYTATSPSGDTYLRYFNEAPLVETRPEPGTSNIVKYINATLDPGVLEYWDQDDEARRFTFRIRRSLKWSDGAPVTTEDVRFCIEDIVFDRELYPVPQEWSEWGGARVKLEIVDRYTFRLEFASSYGIFVQRMAQWRWWWFMLPSHYLKPSHVIRSAARCSRSRRYDLRSPSTQTSKHSCRGCGQPATARAKTGAAGTPKSTPAAGAWRSLSPARSPTSWNTRPSTPGSTSASRATATCSSSAIPTTTRSIRPATSSPTSIT